MKGVDIKNEGISYDSCINFILAGCTSETNSKPTTLDLPWYPKMGMMKGKASYAINDGNIEEAKKYYDSEMIKSGWKKINESSSKNGQIMSVMSKWEKGGKTVHVSFLDHPEKESKDYILFEDEKGTVLALKDK